MFIMLTITDVRSATAIMAEILFQTQTMIIGARAVLGIEFKTTRYGSTMSFKNEFHHKIMAVPVPINVPRIKPAMVSHAVTAVWNKRRELRVISTAESTISFGELNMKESTMPF